mgnify:CR=1 FL=1
MKIRKVVIPAAGLGTRFLPATKAQPKEMLPIVDKPTIQYIVEEAVNSGITHIIIITGRNKRAIEDHFDVSVELELELKSKGKTELLKEVQNISDMVEIHYIRQKRPLGLGHAILKAKEFIGGEPFAVMLGDDVVVSKTPALKQLMDVYEKTNANVLGVKRVAKDQTNKYGIVKPIKDDLTSRLHKVVGLVEKPSPQDAPSNMAIMGRYIINPEIFQKLEELQPGIGGEYQLTDALQALMEEQEMYAYEFEGKRYDVGDKLGFLEATVDFALDRHDLKQEFAAYLKNRVSLLENGK